MKEQIFKLCQSLFPAWHSVTIDDFDFDDPKGFSSFTMGIRCRKDCEPKAVLYRRLADKDNAILDFDSEKEVFLMLGENQIAAHCYHYDRECRIEAFYQGRTLIADDLFDPDNLRQIANQLYKLHQLKPDQVPNRLFFDLLQEKWGQLARRVLEEDLHQFPAEEQELCHSLREIYSPATREKVRQCLPQSEPNFCHNDTYHGNIMKLDNGEIKLLDFEFSCLNYMSYDFASLFAETVMRHQQPHYPYFRIADPEFSEREIGLLINYYLDNKLFESDKARNAEFNRLMEETRRMLIMSDYKYAVAAIPLALNPIQKIRFIPYAHQRFHKFLKSVNSIMD